MKDYKVLFGYAAILLSIGFVIRSIAFAYAFPSGPNVSMGSNPIENIYGNKSGGGSHPASFDTIWTNNSEYDLIVTTMITDDDDCGFGVNGSSLGVYYRVFHTHFSGQSADRYVASPFVRGTAKLKVTSGSTIDIKHSN